MTDYNNGKWHGWNGGECPVHPKTVVEYISGCSGPVRRESSYSKTEAENLVWSGHDGWEIIAFRVIEEHKEPREFWIVKSWYSTGAWDTAREAAKDAEGCNGEVIHVREVIE